MTDSQIIAVFMGKPLKFIHDTGIGVIERGINYDNYYHEWNYLMQVVEKIESLEGISFDILGKASVIRVYQNNDILVKKIVHHDNSKITHVYKSVIDFINFYNSQK